MRDRTSTELAGGAALSGTATKRRTIRHFAKDEHGAFAVEDGVAMALFAAACIGLIEAAGLRLGGIF